MLYCVIVHTFCTTLVLRNLDCSQSGIERKGKTFGVVKTGKKEYCINVTILDHISGSKFWFIWAEWASRVVRCWHGYLSGARCRLAHSPADATATHCLLL